jgi:hypothetical protein
MILIKLFNNNLILLSNMVDIELADLFANQGDELI